MSLVFVERSVTQNFLYPELVLRLDCSLPRAPFLEPNLVIFHLAQDTFPSSGRIARHTDKYRI